MFDGGCLVRKKITRYYQNALKQKPKQQNKEYSAMRASSCDERESLVVSLRAVLVQYRITKKSVLSRLIGPLVPTSKVVGEKGSRYPQ